MKQSPRIQGFFQKAGIIALTACFMIGLSGSIDNSTSASGASTAPLRTVKNTAFTYGEKLTFAVKYRFITAGYAIMHVGSKPKTISGRPCYAISSTVRTTSSFDKIFKVRDSYKTYVDVDGLFPWRFQQTVREGDYKKDFSANIDQKNHIARTTKGSFKVPAYVQDVLSAFYYTRTKNLRKMKKGQSFTMKNFYGKKTNDLRVKVLGKKRVKVKAGTFDCIAVEPLVVEGGLFKNEGSIVIYLTNDARKIPVKVSTKVLVGSIDVELIKYSGVNGKIAAKVR